MTQKNNAGIRRWGSSSNCPIFIHYHNLDPSLSKLLVSFRFLNCSSYPYIPWSFASCLYVYACLLFPSSSTSQLVITCFSDMWTFSHYVELYMCVCVCKEEFDENPWVHSKDCKKFLGCIHFHAHTRMLDLLSLRGRRGRDLDARIRCNRLEGTFTVTTERSIKDCNGASWRNQCLTALGCAHRRKE